MRFANYAALAHQVAVAMIPRPRPRTILAAIHPAAVNRAPGPLTPVGKSLYPATPTANGSASPPVRFASHRLPLASVFVIELRSQSIANGVVRPQSLPELRAKMAEYLASGLRLGWLINPHDRQVEIYRTGQAVQVVSMPILLSGEAVLPGFELQV